MAARLSLPRLLLEASAAVAPGGDPTRSGAASAATAPGGDPTRSGAASAMAPYGALARLSLPRLLEAPAATAPGGDPTRAGAAIRERGLRVAADAGSLLRGLPEAYLARKPIEFLLQTAPADLLLANGEILARKGDGFVTYSNCRASAEEAMIMLNGSQLGGNTMRLWGYRSAIKQDRQNDGWYGCLKCFDPAGFSWSPHLGNSNQQLMNAAYSSTLKNGDPTVTTLMGAGLVLRRGFTGASKLDRRGLSGMMIPRILLCALAFNCFCQACRDCYELCGLMAYAGRRYSPDNWEPFMECMVQHYREEMSLDFQG